MFALKTFLGKFAYPLNAWVAISLVGIILCIRKPRSFAGTLVLLVGTLGLLVAACPVTGYLLLGSLEARAGAELDPGPAELQGVRYVVVLGNIRAGVQLWKRLPDATLIVSSGSYTSEMVRQARAMGVPEKAIAAESEARDTQEQAPKIKSLVKDEPFVLSTWALHMPRTLLIFRAHGLRPIPAPSDFLSHAPLSARWFWPSMLGMLLTRHALHEIGGTLWVLAQSSYGRL